MRKLSFVVLAAFAAILLPSVVQATTYDAAADFSIASNPAGAWSYGYYNTSATTFTPYASSTNNWHGNSSIDAWSQFIYDSNSYSVVGKNTSATVQRESSTGSIFVDPGAVFAHPGNSGEKATFRWTAPSNGTVDISATFQPADRDGGNRDVHVYINGVDQIPGTLVTGGFAGVHNTASDSQTGIAVTAGTTIDFSVGYGSDNFYGNDATQLTANINFVPEPASLVIFALGGIGLLFVARRRRAA